MKTLLKVASILGLVAITAPAYSQVGIDLHFGTPPPRREIIVERPHSDAVWVPGYYAYEPRFARYEWRPGMWRPREEVRAEAYRPDVAHFDRDRMDRARDDRGRMEAPQNARRFEARGRG